MRTGLESRHIRQKGGWLPRESRILLQNADLAKLVSQGNPWPSLQLSDSRNRWASSAAMQPVPAEVIAWR
jgi:hypothetical protein